MTERDGFEHLDLDPRLEKALKHLKFNRPTLVQETAIPLAMQGKDILAKARTGSGKTVAYLIPILQKMLLSNNGIKALILVPTKELACQVFQVIADLTVFCTLDSKITFLNLSEGTLDDQKSELRELPNIIIATPSKIRAHLSANNLNLKESLEMLVIDEADLITSFGYDQDLGVILGFLPRVYQTWLMSATLSSDVSNLKKLVLKNPAILQLQDDESNITQFMIKTSENDKFLILYFLIKLRISPIGTGKVLLFVNSIDRCYKLKLFLEQFGIKACTLNSELPMAARFHIVQEFNRGIYNFLIATDESGQKEANKSKDLEYGVYRGIDFKNVQTVINFDLPRSSKSYFHRIGRTGRGIGNKGYALTFYSQGSPIINSQSTWKKDFKDSTLQDSVLERIQKNQKEEDITEFKFDMTQVEAFRYRVEDALRSVTGASVRDAHLKDIKNEILNSEKLKSHFENRPKDLEALRHDKFVHPSRIQHQLKHVPEYLLPKRSGVSSHTQYSGWVPFTKKKRRIVKKARQRDPLKKF